MILDKKYPSPEVMEEEKDDKGFKVTDRRMFTTDGKQDEKTVTEESQPMEEKPTPPESEKGGEKEEKTEEVPLPEINFSTFVVSLSHSIMAMASHPGFDANLLEVVQDEGGRRVNYQIPPQCEITLGGEPVELIDLRSGDMVDVEHDTPGSASPVGAIRSHETKSSTSAPAAGSLSTVGVVPMAHQSSAWTEGVLTEVK